MALYEKLGPESLWALLQYNPPLWRPATAIDTPLLWLAGGGDTLINEAASGARRPITARPITWSRRRGTISC